MFSRLLQCIRHSSQSSFGFVLGFSAFAAPGGGADCDNPIDEQINGKWRLVYSSTFAGQGGGTQGFTGSPTGGGPLQLGQVGGLEGTEIVLGVSGVGGGVGGLELWG